jgi:hypothetical protein
MGTQGMVVLNLTATVLQPLTCLAGSMKEFLFLFTPSQHLASKHFVTDTDM